jgi:hypothetical protein
MNIKQGWITLVVGIGIVAMIFIVCAFPTRGQTASASTIHATSCSHADVSAAVASAQSGDTVIVPACSATWESNLIITKGLTLQGAGVGSTVITSNYTPPNPGNPSDERNFLIAYKPASPELNEAFRLTGFTLDINNKCEGIQLRNTSATPVNKIRVDHNEILNVSMSGGSARAIMITGTVYGVIDNNTFSGGNTNISSYGLNGTSWDNLTFNFGSADNIYYEDNTFIITNTPHAAGAGGRYCARYNTYIHTNSSAGLYPWYDMHGNQGIGQNHATMGAEIYGNVVTMTYNNGVGMFDQRGGKAVIHNNKVVSTASSSAQAREEYDDSLNPTTNPQPQHISDSYYWNNWGGSRLVGGYERMTEIATATGGGDNYLDDAHANFSSAYANPDRYGLEIVGGTGAGQYRLITDAQPTRLTVAPNWETNPDGTSQYRIVSDCCNVIAEDSEFYNHNVDFDGTTGVGCGLLADRPATCTPGVGYWATEQSCTGVDDASVGAHPETPVSGTLYKCTAPNTWEAYYTPYTYPHPLRGEATLEGDVNGDGLVDIADIQACANHILGFQDWGEAADVNGDGKVDALDIQRIVRILSEE